MDARVLLKCATLVGRSLWVGCADGAIRVFDSVTGAFLHAWPAHLSTLKSLAVIRGTVFSLAKDGSVRGWPALQPPTPAAYDAWKVRRAVWEGRRGGVVGGLGGWRPQTCGRSGG